MLVEAIQAYLAADSVLQGILRTPAQRSDKTTGIFPVMALEQCNVPYIVLMQVSGNAATSMEGTNRFTLTRWRLSNHGSTYKAAKQLAAATKQAMISFNGHYATGAVEVMGSWWVMEADDMEAMPHGTLFTVHQDFNINYIDAEGL